MLGLGAVDSFFAAACLNCGALTGYIHTVATRSALLRPNACRSVRSALWHQGRTGGCYSFAPYCPIADPAGVPFTVQGTGLADCCQSETSSPCCRYPVLNSVLIMCPELLLFAEQHAHTSVSSVSQRTRIHNAQHAGSDGALDLLSA